MSGDSIQIYGGSDLLQFIIANQSIPGTDEGHARAYKNASTRPVDLNLGGHGAYFTDCQRVYAASLKHIQTATEELLALFGNRHPESIFLRPGFRKSANRSRSLMARF